MSIAALTHRHVFGLKGDIKENVHYLDEQTILFPAGSNIVFYNCEQKQQRFLPISESGFPVSALCLSDNKRFLATAERCEKPSINVFDTVTLRRRKSLQPPAESGAKDFISVAFSHNNRFLIGFCTEPEPTVYYWAWEKGKIVSTFRVALPPHGSVNQVSFHPHDDTQICVMGRNLLKIFRYAEGTFRQMTFLKTDGKHYTSHTWVTADRIIAGTIDGQLHMIESGECKHEFTLGTPEQPLTHSIGSLLTFSRGFLCGASNGSVYMYEKTDDRDYYKNTKEIRINEDSYGVHHMAISGTEDNMIVSLENNQLYAMSLAATDLSKEAPPPILSQAFHHGQITGIDTCIRKPIMVTCSTDRSIRVWNYLETTSELVKYFQEEIYSVALHPSGLYLLAGFSDKLRLLNILADDIRPFKEFPLRGCRECCFSNGGQFFAAAHGNTVQVYSTWTFESMLTLKGHIGKVKSIHWTSDDSRIITAGMDGAIYDWNARDGKREGENVLKACSYSSAVCSQDGKITYAVGTDNTLKEIADSQIIREIPSNSTLTYLTLSHSGRMMFTGTSQGAVRSMKFPLGEENFEYQEHAAHSMPVSKLRLSFDDQLLFSVSDDGCLYVFKITERETKAPHKEREIIYSDEILVTKSDVDEKQALTAELRNRVEELKLENEYQLRLKDLTYKDRMKDLSEKLQQDIDTYKIQASMLKSERDQLILRHAEETNEINDRCQRQLTEMEANHNEKILFEYDKYGKLQEQGAIMEMEWESRLRQKQREFQTVLGETSQAYEERLSKKDVEIEQLQAEIQQQLNEYHQTIKDTEEDADTEIVELKASYEKKLKNERENAVQLKGEISIMKKKFASLQKEIDDHKNDIQKMYNEEKKLHNVIKTLEKDILNLRKELQERDETIVDKEKRIYDLKKKNQELEKFKFVLDHKIRELKRQIEPREQSISGMTNQIKEMDAEIETYHKENARLELLIEDYKLRIRALENEVERERETTQHAERVVKRFRTDLQACVTTHTELKALRDGVHALYRKHCKGANDALGLDQDVEAEYQRQREHLEITIASLRNKLNKEAEARRISNIKAMLENSSLTKELNQVRKESLERRHLPSSVRKQEKGPVEPTSTTEELKLPTITTN